jgi:hypothetical protein
MDGVFKSTLSIIFGLVVLGMLLIGLPLLTFYITKYVYSTDIPEEVPRAQREAGNDQVLLDSIHTINEEYERTKRLLQKQEDQNTDLRAMLKGKDRLLSAQQRQSRQLKQKVIHLEEDTALLQQKNSILQDSASIFKTQLIKVTHEFEQLRPKAALTVKAQHKAKIYGLLLLILIMTNILFLTVYRHFLISSSDKQDQNLEIRIEQQESMPSP